MKQSSSIKQHLLGVTAVFLILVTAFTSPPVFAKSNSFNNDEYSLYERTVLVAYTIQKGDTLWAISNKYGVAIEDIKTANKLKGDLIIAGKTLYIPQKTMVVYEDRRVIDNVKDVIPVSVAQKNNIKNKEDTATVASITTVSEADRYWLAKIIEAEAGIEPMEGKIAVGAVVLNRVKEEWFPDTIQEVIFQKVNGVYQFTPAGNGRLKKVEPSAEAYEAADRALAGEDPTDGALYFYNPKISKSTFFKKKSLLASIGNHQFFQ